MKPVADWRIWIRLTATILLVLVVAWSGMIYWQSQVNRDTAIRQAQDFSRSIHDMTMAGLTGMMITGTIQQREVFLDQIIQLSLIKDLHVVRSESVSRLYGPNTKSKRSLDGIEQAVMKSGQDYSAVESSGDGAYLRVVTPVKASRNYLGKDCITCHQTPENTVLGLVSMKICNYSGCLACFMLMIWHGRTFRS